MSCPDDVEEADDLLTQLFAEPLTTEELAYLIGQLEDTLRVVRVLYNARLGWVIKEEP